MLMRYHWALGVGHMYAHSKERDLSQAYGQTGPGDDHTETERGRQEEADVDVAFETAAQPPLHQPENSDDEDSTDFEDETADEISDEEDDIFLARQEMYFEV